MTSSSCQCCGTTAPTIKVSLHRHIGALILMFHKSLKGNFCKRCVSKTFWEYSLVTLFLGWWGLISMFVTPVVLVANIVMYIRSLFMPAREYVGGDR